MKESYKTSTVLEIYKKTVITDIWGMSAGHIWGIGERISDWKGSVLKMSTKSPPITWSLLPYYLSISHSKFGDYFEPHGRGWGFEESPNGPFFHILCFIFLLDIWNPLQKVLFNLFPSNLYCWRDWMAFYFCLIPTTYNWYFTRFGMNVMFSSK